MKRLNNYVKKDKKLLTDEPKTLSMSAWKEGGAIEREEEIDSAENWTRGESKVTHSETITWQASDGMDNACDYGSENVTWIGMFAAASILLSSLKQFEITTATCIGFP